MKKILSLALAALMLVSAVPMVYAAETDNTQDYSMGTTIEGVATGTEEYTVTVPAKLATGGSGMVTLSGTWASDRIVTVSANISPEGKVKLRNTKYTELTTEVLVTFPTINCPGSDIVSVSRSQAITIGELPDDVLFGTWSGILTYSVNIRDAA